MSLRDLMRLGRHEEVSGHEEVQGVAAKGVPAHAIDSTFRAARVRFELECSCGAAFDTPFIDEALEWHELHLQLAPLADQLPA